METCATRLGIASPFGGASKFRPAPTAACLLVGVVLSIILVSNVIAAGPVELPRQVITMPPNTDAPLFADVEQNGRLDLLALDPVGRKLFNYHQRPNGFSKVPDQVISLPPQTAWVALCDVDSHAGLELLFSTADGLFYSRQDAGLFEAERHTLIAERQAIGVFDSPTLTLIASTNAASGISIPVFVGDQIQMYRRNDAYEWRAAPSASLDAKKTMRDASHDPWRVGWAAGPNPGRSLRVQQFFGVPPDTNRDEELETKPILDYLKDDPENMQPGISRADINGDGREDLLLWRSSFKLDFKTDIYIFLRDADGQLPRRPTQSLHCGGFPVPDNTMASEASPLHDLRGDGNRELVLMEPTTVFTTPGGLIDMVLSHGVDASLTIRSLRRGAFARNVDASVPVKFLLEIDAWGAWPFCIQGDFNGDGRPDLLIRRSETQWNIFFSTADDRWFMSEPGLTFTTPARGAFRIIDLNGDGLADIVWYETDRPDISIFISPSRPAKGKHP